MLTAQKTELQQQLDQQTAEAQVLPYAVGCGARGRGRALFPVLIHLRKGARPLGYRSGHPLSAGLRCGGGPGLPMP